MVRAYEAVYILDPALDDARWDAEIEAVKQTITGKGGEVKEVQKWGRRRLAYEIQKKKEGIYTLVRFDSETDVPAELNRRFRLNESVMRHLVVLHEEYTPPPPVEEGHEYEGRGRDRDRWGWDDRPERGERGERGERHERFRHERPRPAPASAEAAPAREE